MQTQRTDGTGWQLGYYTTISQYGIDKLKRMAAKSDEPVEFIAPVSGFLPSRPARINITSTSAKIDEITAFARKIGSSRSELMVNATLDYIRANA